MSNRLLKLASQAGIVKGVRDLYSYVRDSRRGTFSQHGEDVWLDNHFGGMEGGYYVDVGASHPTRLSNTWWLYEHRGWHGVTVEPIAEMAEAHRKRRPRDTQVQACIGPKPGKRTFYEMSPSVLSTLDQATALAAVRAGTGRIWRTYEMDVLTLDQLFGRYVYPRKVDFLSLDMEGLDALVVTKCDFANLWRPSVICVEAAQPRERVRLLGHLEFCGYRLAAELGCNLLVEDVR